MPNPLEIQKTPLLNLAAKMDPRSNNEVLDWKLTSNQIGLPLVFLQNQDLFYTKAITSREGVVDICGGIVNASGNPTAIYNLYSGTGTVNGFSAQPVYLSTTFPDREGMFINFGNQTASGISSFLINGGTFFLQDRSATQNVIEGNYDIAVQIYLAQVSGLSLTNPSVFTDSFYSQSHSIGLSGNYNLLPKAPSLVNPSNTLQTATFTDPTPLAISNITTVNFGPSSNYTQLSGTGLFTSPWIEVPWQFSAPYPLGANTTYYMYIVANNTSGTTGRDIYCQIMYDNKDDAINLMYANKFNNNISGTNFTDIIRPFENSFPLSGSTKSWLRGEVDQYNTPSYIILESAGVAGVATAPISGSVANPADGLFYATNFQSAPNSLPFNGLTSEPTVSTTTTEFGETFLLPSGTYTINGAYIFANAWANSNWNEFTADNSINSIVNPTGYSISYNCNLYETFGTISGVLQTNLITTYSGNYTFNNPNNYQNTYYNQNSPGAGINSNIEQIYAVFPQAPTITNVSGIYLLAWEFFNPVTGAPLSDYAVTTINISGQNYYEIASPILIGTTNTGGEQYYQRGSGGFIIPSGNQIDIACGFLSVNTGNAITSIYDYRVGDNRSQAVMFTQGQTLNYFELADPTITTTIYSSGVLPSGSVSYPDAKWGHCTFQDLLFSHQYGLVSGICWDQIYSQPTGNWTQLHGLQPVFSGSSANLSAFPSGSGVYPTSGIPSGSSFSVIASTSILSGGYRASLPLNISGTTGNALQISGIYSSTNQATSPYDIYHVSGITHSSGQSQYQFDVNSLGTYIWATQNSGVVYYLAPLCDSSGNEYPNPIPNNNSWNSYAPFYSGTTPSGHTTGSGVYIYDISFSGINANYVANVIDYDQTYITEQIPVPIFKKMLVWNNLLIGIGDDQNPSRLWVSQQGAPQIFGSLGDINFYYVDIDVDNGQVITGMEIFKGYLIIFKENSTYLAQYTSQAGAYFSIQQIDNVYGNLSIFSTVSTSLGVFALSQYGPIVANWYGCKPVANEMIPYYNTIDHDNLIYSVAIHYADRGQILWSISNANESPNNQNGLVYNYLENAWGIRQNGMWNCAGNIGDTNNFSLLMIGDTLGQIKQINSGTYGDDVLFVNTATEQTFQNVDLSFETPWLNFMNSQNLKQLKTLRVNCQDSDQILKIDVYFNEIDTAPVYTRFLNMNAPVYNRVVSLAGLCRTVKFVVSSVGTADQIKLNSIQLTYIDRDLNGNLR